MIDYYEILKISPAANAGEIRQAYRKLARCYHPDKNPGDKGALARFHLIKEAYETLTKPQLKAHYLQQRWLYKANGRYPQKLMETPEQLLKVFLDAGKLVSQMDIYRLNREGLYISFDALLSEKNIETLNSFNEIDINGEIVDSCLNSLAVLDPRDQLAITGKLSQIKAGRDQARWIAAERNKLRTRVKWERYRLLLIIVVVTLLCLLVWYSTHFSG